MSSCELCFSIAVNAFHEGIMSADTFDAIILSSLISSFAGPFFLRRLLHSERDEKELEIARARAETGAASFEDNFDDGDDESVSLTTDSEVSERK